MAEIATVEQICATISSSGFDVPISVALGELTDWIERPRVPSLPTGITFAKLGLSRIARQENWCEDWQTVRTRFEEVRGKTLRWVGVAYADSAAANAPHIEDVCTAAIETGCTGLLIDTFAKSGSDLTAYVTIGQLESLADRCRSAGLFLALAGSLTLQSLEVLQTIGVNVIAIRSAACRDANRVESIDSARVKRFCEAITKTWAQTSIL